MVAYKFFLFLLNSSPTQTRTSNPTCGFYYSPKIEQTFEMLELEVAAIITGYIVMFNRNDSEKKASFLEIYIQDDNNIEALVEYYQCLMENVIEALSNNKHSNMFEKTILVLSILKDSLIALRKDETRKTVYSEIAAHIGNIRHCKLELMYFTILQNFTFYAIRPFRNEPEILEINFENRNFQLQKSRNTLYVEELSQIQVFFGTKFFEHTKFIVKIDEYKLVDIIFLFHSSMPDGTSILNGAGRNAALDLKFMEFLAEKFPCLKAHKQCIEVCYVSRAYIFHKIDYIMRFTKLYKKLGFDIEYYCNCLSIVKKYFEDVFLKNMQTEEKQVLLIICNDRLNFF